MKNIAYETKKNDRVRDAWNISLKYSNILMDNSKDDKFFNIYLTIYGEYLSELKRKRIYFKDKNYVKIWETMVNTQLRNPKRDVRAGSIKLLHQTNVQRLEIMNR
jgi:hypothetical protein